MSDESEDSNWQKRVSRANCREPYKTALDTLASLWIEGAISDTELALELWKVHNDCRNAIDDHDIQNSGKMFGRKRLDLTDVEREILILADCVTVACDIPKGKSDPELRNTWLEVMRTESLMKSFRSR